MRCRYPRQPAAKKKTLRSRSIRPPMRRCPRRRRQTPRAWPAPASQRSAAALLALYPPEGDGLDALARCLELHPAPAVIVMTARAEIHGAVVATRRGAADYLAKPLDLDDLGARLEHALG